MARPTQLVLAVAVPSPFLAGAMAGKGAAAKKTKGAGKGGDSKAAMEEYKRKMKERTE